MGYKSLYDNIFVPSLFDGEKEIIMKYIIKIMSMLLMCSIVVNMLFVDNSYAAESNLDVVGFKAVKNGIDIINEPLYLIQGEAIDISLTLKSNQTEGNQSYAVLFTLTYGDSRMLCNKVVEGNINAGSIQNVNTDIIVPENINGDAVLKYFIWNSLSDMKSLYPASSDNSNGNIEGLQCVQSAGKVNISGKISSGSEGKKVTVMIFNPSKSPSDLPNDLSAISTACETQTSQNGEFALQFSINVKQTGVYTAYIRSEECASVTTIAFFVATYGDIANAIAAINNTNDATIMQQNLQEFANILSYRSLPFDSVNINTLAEKLVNKVRIAPFANNVEIQRWIMEQSVVEAYNQSRIDIVYGANGEFNYPELLGFEQLDSQTGSTIYNTYTNIPTEVGKEFVRSRMLNQNFMNMLDLQKSWIEKTVLAAIKYANGDMDIHKVLIENGNAVGLPMHMYMSMSAENIVLVDKMLMTLNYSTIIDLKDAMVRCITEINKSTTPSSGGGGSSSGGPSSAMLLLQDFDSSTLIPDGWVSEKLVPILGTEASWSINSTPLFSPPNCLMFNSYDAGNGNSARFHTTVGNGINIDNYTTAIVNFYMYHNDDFSNSNDTIQVQYSTDGGVTWNNEGSSISRTDGTDWEQHSVILNDISGSDVLIGLLGTSAYGDNIFIDNISVTVQPILPTAVVPLGLGTQAQPYIIASAGNLVWITKNNELSSGFIGKYFEQTTNIALRGEWVPIGDKNNKFNGIYNGNGHYISGINISLGNQANTQGLFSDVGNDGRIEKLSVIVNINSSGSYVGALAGNNSGTITNCYSSGMLEANEGNVGGLVGNNSGIICNSYATNNVSVNCYVDQIGGLVGYNQSTIANCFTLGYTNGNGSGITYSSFIGSNYNFVGGLAGMNSGTIANCYTTGSTIGIAFGGYNHPVGGLVGGNDGTITNCYYNQGVNGVYENNGTVKLCLQQPFGFYTTALTYTTASNWNSQYLWDFDNIWGISEIVNDGLPYLFNVESASIPDFNFKGSSLGENPSNVVYPTEGGQHNLWVTYQNNTNIPQNTTFIAVVKKNYKVISIYTEKIFFIPFEEVSFNRSIYIPATIDSANVEVDFFLWDGLNSMKPKHDTVKNSINNVR